MRARNPISGNPVEINHLVAVVVHENDSVMAALCLALLLTVAPSTPTQAIGPQRPSAEASSLPSPDAATESSSDQNDEALVSLRELLNYRLSASSFFEVSRETAPGATYVIDHRKLAASPARTLADSIEMAVPGMQIARHLWTGALIGVRGITIDNNAKTLVMLDGLNLNMRTHFGTHGLLSVPLLDDIEGLEVSLGPGALVHGAGAINGYVNLRPKDGARHRGFTATVEAGPVEAFGAAQLSYGMTYGNTNNLFLYGGFAGAAGFSPRRDLAWSCTGPDQAGNTACPYDFIRARDQGPSGKLSLNWNHGGLNVLAVFATAQLSTEGNALYDWFNFEDPYWLTTIFALRPAYTHNVGDKEDLVLSGTLVLQDFGFVPRHPRRPGVVGGLPVELNGTARGGRESWQSMRALWRTIRIPLHSLAVGGEIGHRSFGRAKQFFGHSELLGLEEVEFRWLEFGAFVEDTFAWRNLSVTGGVRCEYFKIPRHFQADTYTEADTKETVTPSPVTLSDQLALVKRLGIAWAASADTTLKASYQDGFRNPDAAYYTHWAARSAIKDRMGMPALPALANETMNSFELNLSERLASAVALTVNAYYNRYHGLLAWNAKEDAFVNTIEVIQSIGTEVSLDFAAGGTRLGLSYGHSRPVDYSDAAYAGLALTDSTPALPDGKSGASAGGHSSWKVFSPHQVKLGVSHALWDRRLGLSANAALFSKVHDPNWAAGQAHRFVAHAAVTLQLTPQVTAKLVVQNLTGNTVPASRIENDLTQVGNLGIEQRLAYLSLSLAAN